MLLRQSLSRSGGASPAAMPEDLFTVIPGGREGLRPTRHRCWVVRTTGKKRQPLLGEHLSQYHKALDSRLRVGHTPPLAGGRDRDQAGPLRQRTACVWRGEMRREDGPPFTLSGARDPL